MPKIKAKKNMTRSTIPSSIDVASTKHPSPFVWTTANIAAIISRAEAYDKMMKGSKTDFGLSLLRGIKPQITQNHLKDFLGSLELLKRPRINFVQGQGWQLLG